MFYQEQIVKSMVTQNQNLKKVESKNFTVDYNYLEGNILIF